MTDSLVANEIGPDYDDRALNKAVAAYTAQLHMAERDVKLAEAEALVLAMDLGKNAEERKIGTVLYLAGQLGMSEEQKEAVARYRKALALADQIEHDLKYLQAEQQSRRHERTEAQTAAYEALVAAGYTLQRAA